MPEAFFAYAGEKLTVFGERVAGAIDDRAVHTDREGQPQLIKYDKMGNEINEVWVNEGYRETVKETYETALSAMFTRKFLSLAIKGIMCTRMRKATCFPKRNRAFIVQ